MNWDNGGDPWLEHLLCTPTCTFVKLNKGISYINEAYTSYLSDNTSYLSDNTSRVSIFLVILKCKCINYTYFYCFTESVKI